MKKPQEFYIVLRVVTDPEANKGRKITEDGIRAMLKKSINDDRIETIRIGDVIDVTK